MLRFSCMWIGLAIVVNASAAFSQDAPTNREVDNLPSTLQELRAKTHYESWDKHKFYSRTLKHYRTVLMHDGCNVVLAETGKSPDKIEFVEVIKSPGEVTNVEFAIYDYQTGKRLHKYPDGVTFPIEGAPDGSKESTPAVCIWCHHEQRPFVSVIPFDQSFQDSMDRVRNRIGIRQSLVDAIPNTDKSRERLEALNRRMEKSFPGRYSDMRVWLQSAIESR